MYLHLLGLLSPLSCALLVQSYSGPELDNILSLYVNITAPFPNVECGPPPTMLFGSIPLSDCVAAMNEFPNSTESGVFHKVGSPGLHQLPQEHTSAGCTVKVDIVGDIVADVGSWHGIKKAAAGVMVGCPYGERRTSTDGGNSTAGNTGHVLVTVTRPQSRSRMPWF